MPMVCQGTDAILMHHSHRPAVQVFTLKYRPRHISLGDTPPPLGPDSADHARCRCYKSPGIAQNEKQLGPDDDHIQTDIPANQPSRHRRPSTAPSPIPRTRRDPVMAQRLLGVVDRRQQLKLLPRRIRIAIRYLSFYF